MIERPERCPIDALFWTGHPELPVKPNVIKTWRESAVLSDTKSNPGDAHVIADHLRGRIHRLRPAAPLAGATEAIRTVTPTRGEPVAAGVAATDQLAALLDSHRPGYNNAQVTGKDHPHAARALARAWVLIMWWCWQDSTPYDPALQGGAREHAEHRPAA